MRTYGTARLEGPCWVLELEPHVAIRARRVFGRAGKQIGTIKIACTDEVSRDLLWFCDRYPLEVSPREKLVEKAARFDARVERYSRVLDGRLAPRPFQLAIPPREYQRLAAELALQTNGLLLADDVGLGKTCSAIAMLSDPSTRPAVVVTLTHLPRQWRRELERFAPGLRVAVANKGTAYDLKPKSRKRKKSVDQLGLLDPADAAPREPDVIVLTYSKLRGWAEALRGKIRTIIFDECQELRHNGTAKHDAAKLIAEHCEYRVGLSATPVYNYGIEVFNILQIIRPSALGTREEFLEEWCRGSGANDRKSPVAEPRALGTYLREAGLMLRRTRTDVQRELPPLTKSVVHVEADEQALDAVEKDVAELARIILAKGGAWDEKGRAARDMDWRLRQATRIAKAPYVAEFVKLLIESGEQVVLYGWHREVYELWLARLKDHNPVLYTGSESASKKEKSARAFVDGSAKVLIISLRAGAGLDGLQGHCRNVVFGELDWSPGVHEQAIGRVHRDGQGDPVMAYFLVSDTGADPAMMGVLGLKREQVEGVRDPNIDVLETVKVDAVKELARAYLKQRGLALPDEGEAAA